MGIAGGRSRRGGGRGPSTTAAPSACCNARNAVSAYREYRFKKVVADSVTFMKKLGLFVIQKQVFPPAPQKNNYKKRQCFMVHNKDDQLFYLLDRCNFGRDL
jgi:hypothetical protein